VADDRHSPEAPKSSRSGPEIWLRPALCKIAAATGVDPATVAHILPQGDLHQGDLRQGDLRQGRPARSPAPTGCHICRQIWNWLRLRPTGKSRLAGKVMIVQGKSLRPTFAAASNRRCPRRRPSLPPAGLTCPLTCAGGSGHFAPNEPAM